MDKEKMTIALDGCGGADGIDLDKNKAHIEKQERIAFEQRLAVKKFENAMVKQKLVQKALDEENDEKLKKKLHGERILRENSPDAGAPTTDKKQFKIIKVKQQTKSSTHQKYKLG